MTNIYSDTYKSPAGMLYIAVDGDGGLICLSFSQNNRYIVSSIPVKGQCDRVKTELKEYFSGIRQKFSVNLRPRGTDFQKLVWNTLTSVPIGTTITYKELAKKTGRPKAVRAAANAVGANPIIIIIPCHRIIASDGTLGGYSAAAGDGGPKNKENLKIKKYLIDLEAKYQN